MFTVDANKCPACPEKETCADRKKILPVLSTLAHELTTDPAFADSPGDGIIIFVCHHKF